MSNCGKMNGCVKARVTDCRNLMYNLSYISCALFLTVMSDLHELKAQIAQFHMTCRHQCDLCEQFHQDEQMRLSMQLGE